MSVLVGWSDRFDNCLSFKSVFDIRDLTKRGQRRQRKPYLKSEFAFLQSSSRFFQINHFVKWIELSWSWTVKSLSYPSSERERKSSFVYVLHETWNWALSCPSRAKTVQWLLVGIMFVMLFQISNMWVLELRQPLPLVQVLNTLSTIPSGISSHFSHEVCSVFTISFSYSMPVKVQTRLYKFRAQYLIDSFARYLAINSHK